MGAPVRRSRGCWRRHPASAPGAVAAAARTFYQCVQQPHILWANTRWTSEGAHNRLAQTMMKVRKDDRVASAYFRPGLYYEIFAGEISEATIGAGASGAPGYVAAGARR